VKPSPGRIVWYRPNPAEDARSSAVPQEVLPALIVAVHSDEVVNLRVFSDGPAVTDYWKKSVRFGKEQGQWCWPQRSE